MIYVYAFVDDPGVEVDDLTGVDGGLLFVVPGRSASAVVSERDDLPVRTDVSALQEHERVTAALVDRCAVAPARFGTVVGGRGDLERQLEERGGHLARLFPALRGRVELALRAQLRDPSAATSGTAGAAAPTAARSVAPAGDRPGRRYLDGLRGPGQGGEAAGALAALHTELSQLASAASSDFDDEGTLVASYLVPAERVTAFWDGFADQAAERPEVALSLTGPWAPYSFVGGGC